MIRKIMSDTLADLADNEKIHAIADHGLFNSDHEAYAIIKEEVEEADTELDLMHSCLDTVWNRIKRDMDVNVDLSELGSIALSCAAECVQVAAMCKKKCD